MAFRNECKETISIIFKEKSERNHGFSFWNIINYSLITNYKIDKSKEGEACENSFLFDFFIYQSFREKSKEIDGFSF
jgi:hypothetical protein